MASFTDILKSKPSEFKAPQPFPVGTYHCLVDGPPAEEESSQKKTPCRVYKFRILKAGDDVDQAAAAEQQVVGKFINGQGIGTAFYKVPEAMFRYTEFLVEHLGIEQMHPDGTEKSFEELEAEAPGKQVLVKLKHELSADGKRVYSRVVSTAHV
jgi:hypothetical protein